MIYLDPHTNQEAVPMGDLDSLKDWKPDSSYHCDDLTKTEVGRLETSSAMVRLRRLRV